jgi:transcriptional regulator with XRE-family HTH domain
MNDKNVREILDKIALPANENLLKELKWRQANRAWLRKSQAIAIKILSTLRTHGISQKELAEKMGVSPQMVNKIVKGSENLTLETISKIEVALGIHLIETAETLKEKLNHYEEIFHGMSETLKNIVKIFEPKKEVELPKVEIPQYITTLCRINTQTSTKGMSNLKENEPKYAMVA